jgi:adenine-specific DNA-methyltransferase
MPFETKKTELLWPGKYDEDGKRQEPPRVPVPFQVIERVNESRATRELEKRRDLTLFDVWKGEEGDTFEEGWRNKLIWGDNLLVMSSLLDQFAGKIDLIYIDPPFATGADFSMSVPVGEGGPDVHKEPSLVEEKAYRDTWGGGIGSYIDMMSERLALMRELLNESGSIYVHLDATVGHYVKVLMDELFGADSFQREIVWRIGWISGYKSAAKNWIRNHDVILFYVKTPGEFTFNKEYIPYPEGYERRGGGEFTGKGYPIEDVWNASPLEQQLTGEESLDSIQIKSFSGEKTGYATQKNESILRRIIRASSTDSGLVADFFCGSGTTQAVAENLGRRWIGADIGRYAIHTTRKRLLDISGCRPFEVLNLGKYERQYWQVATFGEDLDEDGSIALYEYVAFILRLYGAMAVSGMGSLHGKLGKAFVHVGAVDSPVTIQEIAEAIQESKAVKSSELHVLGWEWEMGVNDLMVEQAKQEGVKLVLRQIPREVMETQAAVRGDVRFFELAYVEFEVKPTRDKRSFQVVLRDFAIPNPELVPDEVRSKIKKWPDYVDYWAVDWEFREDTFMQGWVTYRTRKDRSLELKSDIHTYEEAGEYAVMVKVIDIFGNDTSKVVRVQVK